MVMVLMALGGGDGSDADGDGGRGARGGDVGNGRSYDGADPGLSSFRMDWLDLFAVQGTLRSLLQQHSSKA